MTGSSTPSTSHDASARTQEDVEYSCALNANVSNFVSVKLSSDRNYHLWETQMGCLLKSYNLLDIVYGPTIHPQIKNRFDNLVKGWIFGTISEGLLDTVVDIGSAKEVWDKLKSLYDPTITSSEKAQRNEGKRETEDIYKVSTERITDDMDMVSAETTINDKDVVPKEPDVLTKVTEGQHIITIENPWKRFKTQSHRQNSELKGEHIKTKRKNKIIRNKELLKAIVEGDWGEIVSIIKEDNDVITEAINSDGNTMLHIAVGLYRNNLVKEILHLIEGENLPKMINLDGSTALHIAAIVGNKSAAELLVKKNGSLLEISDHKRETPLDKAYENMHLDTIEYLLKATSDGVKILKKKDSLNPGVNIGVNLLVNAISVVVR